MAKKIYFVAPEGDSTGGVETLHQAVSCINDAGGDAYVVYCKNIWDHEYLIKEPVEIQEKFKQYNIKVAQHIDDSKENLLIVPEIFTKFCYQFKKIQKAIWWLSWNFYEDRSFQIRALHFMRKRGLPDFLASMGVVWYTLTKGWQFDFGLDKNKYRHFYNCEYIHQLLISKGIREENTMYLCGMIRDDYLEAEIDLTKKENIIIYNPAKDKRKFAEKVFFANNLDKRGYKIIPIEKMNPVQIKEMMGKSKVYLDFGFFPGPERMPREAVVMGCNLITSNIGAAANDIDVPIPTKYKFAPTDENIAFIGVQIIELMENFESHHKEYNKYRTKVKEQKPLFYKNIIRLCK